MILIPRINNVNSPSRPGQGRSGRRGIPVKIEAEVRNRIGEQVEKSANVIGEIPGTGLKDEIVMMGAHFDSWHASSGATDDAAGCTVALEVARILKAIVIRPRRTIRVAMWAGEEQGLHGSREYVLKHFGDPKDPKVGVKPDYEKFSVYFSQDYGAGAFRGVNLQGNEFVRPIFAAWLRPLRDLVPAMPKLAWRTRRLPRIIPRAPASGTGLAGPEQRNPARRPRRSN